MTRVSWPPTGRSIGLFAWLAAGTLGVVLVLLLPGWTAPWYAAFHLTALAGVVVLAAGALGTRGSAAAVWWLLAGYQATNAAGDLVYNYQAGTEVGVTSPGPTDAFYLVASLLGIAALIVLLWARRSPADPATLIDTAIIVVAMASVLGVLVVAPAIEGAEVETAALIVVFAYPLLDLAVLGGILRILIGGATRNVSLMLVAASFATYLAIDLVYSVVEVAQIDPGSVPWVDATFLAAGVLMVAAVLAPGARRITSMERAVDRFEPSRIRLFGVGVGVLTAPVLLFLVLDGTSLVLARVLVVATIVVLVLALLRLRILIQTVQRQTRELARQALTDSLTGLPNRRAWDSALSESARRCDAAGQPLTIAVLDLDRFKEFNDTLGHQAGDAHLSAFARSGLIALRGDGQLYRIGGEEFGIVIPHLAPDSAREVLERVRGAVAAPETASVGYAERVFGENPFDSVQRADRALYAAKEAGRDRLVGHPGPGADIEVGATPAEG